MFVVKVPEEQNLPEIVRRYGHLENDIFVKTFIIRSDLTVPIFNSSMIFIGRESV